MSKKDYIAIAKIIKNQLGNTHHLTPLVNTLSSYFADDNPQFDKIKFRNACLNGKPEIRKPEGMPILPPENERAIDDGPMKISSHNQTDSIDIDRILADSIIATKNMTERNRKVAASFRKKT